LVWILKLNLKTDLDLKSLLFNIKKLNFTFEKVKKRNHPDQYNLLNLEQGIELLHILDKSALIPELEAKYAELNPFIQLNCCICMEDKCETEMCKMRIKVGETSQNSCDCNTDICGECIKLITKCPTCRTQFTHRSWVK